MKPPLVLLALAAALAAASVASATGDPPRPERPGAVCRPRVALILRGTFLSGGTASFQMFVLRASQYGRALRGSREVGVNAQTRFRRNGEPATLASLQTGDRLLVYARGCKLARTRRTRSVRLKLLAKHVFAHAPREAETRP